MFCCRVKSGSYCSNPINFAIDIPSSHAEQQRSCPESEIGRQVVFRSKDRIPGCGSGYAPELQGSSSSEVKNFFRVLFVKPADKGGCGSLGAGKDCGTLVIKNHE
ncbi:hypothetical protein TNCT_181371 [Trichonephila clavata]|uniref:Uncharacterized protein n=1 Tax=Trichonephila clavata TaxID=2740835 RepID=A0A8X6M6P9_TRICU|nr:hypothetical protein TNCT_181371 [Trichonephila clavata]